MLCKSYNSTLILVHDIFRELTKHSSGVVALRNIDDFDFLKYTPIIGQGFSIKQLDTLFGSGFSIFGENKISSMEECKYVHKKNRENVIITVPIKKSDYEFESFIFLSHKADILDHVTGIHIPAMVLLESARQSMLSIIQRNFLEHIGLNARFTILSTAAHFHAFAFPAQIKISSLIRNLQFNKKGGIHAFLDSSIWQKDSLCASFTIEFSCRNEQLILSHEASVFSRRFSR